MPLRKPVAAQLLLAFVIMAALGFLSTSPGLHITDLGEVCTLLLYSGLAMSTKINSRWVLYVFLPAFLLVVFIVFYAYIFSAREHSPLMFSILAQRYYLYVLIGPIVYMLYARGWRLVDFRRVFVSAVFLTLMARVGSDIASPHSLLLSGSFGTLRLNTVYEQAYLIRRLDMTSLFSAFYFARGIFSSRNLFWAGFRLTITVLSVVLLAITVPRTLLAAAIIALVLYMVFLARPVRAKLLVILLPLYVVILWISLPQAGEMFVHTFGHDPSYTARIETSLKAWQAFSQHPLFGFGNDSVRAVSFQELFGAHFFPSDVGLLGVAFQYGLVGAILYLFFSAWLFVNLLRILWASSTRVNVEERTFLWTLFMVSSLIIIASPVQAKFVYGDGLPIAAFAWGLLMSHKHGLSTWRSKLAAAKAPPRSPQPVVGAAVGEERH